MKDFIMITLGTGVGSGIVINGQMVYGHDGFAGELGHTIIRRENGRLCGCGRHGCLETYCSATGVKVKDVQPEVERLVKAAHYIAPDDKQAVMLLNAEAMFSMMDNLMIGVRFLIWMVGLGTLFAGAIGVSNIMMVTVKERTTEIGIRRAIGARPKDILQQILSESMVLTTIAGMAGISFAVFVLQILEKAANDPGVIKTHYQVSFGLAIGTCILLIALGVLAGLAPAYRAMAIKPIEAIRDE
jgi:putative ABC transport system permease protein